jgi:hypothetical protein
MDMSSLFAWLISHQPAVLFSQNKPATSNQPAVLFSQNKLAPATSHQPNEQAGGATQGRKPLAGDSTVQQIPGWHSPHGSPHPTDVWKAGLPNLAQTFGATIQFCF